ncbi:hypothetical protein F2Q69_00007558 [Brassica cretica]|uniref:Uncharacterized protein n=1 Tax=Brassica cretica TaxID=69181 RepID=A0A8S9P7S4_BRACR|nr:hypothetical protein F2Q69_00007558 [Brassica cretica]
MLETSVLGLGQDLGLITALGGAMTTSTYVSRIVFDLIPSHFKVRDMFSAYVTDCCLAVSDGAMVSQIFWLGVKDVFTHKTKDVVGRGLNHGTLTFKGQRALVEIDRPSFARVIRLKMADSHIKQFYALGRRTLRGLIQNKCGVSCKMIACLEVTEGNETQKPVKVAWSYSWSVTEVYFTTIYSHNVFHWFFERILMTHSFLERIGQSEVDLANNREESVPSNVLDATFILEFSSSQMFSMLFRDSLGFNIN